MAWPWQSEPEKVVERVYVPVPSYGSHNDLWENPTYLAEVRSISTSRVWVSEVTELIRMMRDMADNCEAPERLVGVNLCVGLAKQLLILSPLADGHIKNAAARVEAERIAKLGV